MIDIKVSVIISCTSTYFHICSVTWHLCSVSPKHRGTRNHCTSTAGAVVLRRAVCSSTLLAMSMEAIGCWSHIEKLDEMYGGNMGNLWDMGKYWEHIGNILGKYWESKGWYRKSTKIIHGLKVTMAFGNGKTNWKKTAVWVKSVREPTQAKNADFTNKNWTFLSGTQTWRSGNATRIMDY